MFLRYKKALYYHVGIQSTNKAGSKHNKPFALVVPVIGQCKVHILVYIQTEGSYTNKLQTVHVSVYQVFSRTSKNLFSACIKRLKLNVIIKHTNLVTVW